MRPGDGGRRAEDTDPVLMTCNGHLAIDLGAESGRAVLGALDGGGLRLDEVHRFTNTPLRLPDGLSWNVGGLLEGILEGIRRGADTASRRGWRLATVGVDTWGVDLALVGRSGAVLGLPRCYRDGRVNAPYARALELVGAETLYDVTGIQLMAINSLFQMMANVDETPELTASADRLLFMSDLFHYLLSGTIANEETIVSTSQMTDARTGAWAAHLLERLGVPTGALGDIVPAGTTLGPLRPELADQLGLGSVPQVVTPAGHDTACAVAAVPAETGTAWCYISSGTWSCLGAELDAPCLEGREAPFTNERGVGGTIRFLQNIAGLWLVQECRRALARDGLDLDYAQLTKAAAGAAPLRTLVDTRHGPLAVPGALPDKIATYASETGQPVPADPGALVRCCLESLALAYRRALGQLESVLDRRFDVIHVVGGGGRNTLLNRMTADATGRQVVIGPLEATATGNVLIQAMSTGSIRDLAHLRAVVREATDLQTIEPGDTAPWDDAAARYESLPV
jgi:rhamnulokinase